MIDIEYLPSYQAAELYHMDDMKDCRWLEDQTKCENYKPKSDNNSDCICHRKDFWKGHDICNGECQKNEETKGD